jgi:hypothetical protein
VNLGAHFSFFSRSRNTPRRFAALVAVFAVIFQALLFAWHHHELPFASRGAPVVVAAATGSAAPALADRDCPICSAVAHHGAVPAELLATLLPKGSVLRQLPPPTPADSRTPYLFFRSRAPPSA